MIVKLVGIIVESGNLKELKFRTAEPDMSR